MFPTESLISKLEQSYDRLCKYEIQQDSELVNVRNELLLIINALYTFYSGGQSK